MTLPNGPGTEGADDGTGTRADGRDRGTAAHDAAPAEATTMPLFLGGAAAGEAPGHGPDHPTAAVPAATG
ncbi:hypothetical protein AB6N36_35540, partial [Streptomyces nitrosporeus]